MPQFTDIEQEEAAAQNDYDLRNPPAFDGDVDADADVVGYLYDLDVRPDDNPGRVGVKLEFQYGADRIKRSVSIKFAESEIPGGSHARLGSASGGRRTLSFTLDFDNETDDQGWVKDRVDWLESLTLPDYDENRNQIADRHRVLFVFGKSYSRVCKLVGFEAELGPRWYKSLLPREAKVNIVLADFVTDQVSYRWARK